MSLSLYKLEAVVKFSDYFKSRKKLFARSINTVTYIYMYVDWRLIKKIPEIFTSNKNINTFLLVLEDSDEGISWISFSHIFSFRKTN